MTKGRDTAKLVNPGSEADARGGPNSTSVLLT